MAPPAHDREPRKVPTLSVFNKRTPVLKTVPAASWVNLRWKTNAKKDQLFFASPSGRFTPISGKVPSLYLSPTERTSFKELYGDTIAAARNDDVEPIIEANDLSNRVFIDINAPEYRLVDLSTGDGLDAVGIDVGTAYHTVIDHPRAWAQVIYDHDIKADGIFYESRHTKELCAAVWLRSPKHGCSFANERTLGTRATVALTGGVSLFGEELLLAF
jgi:hypothetical protein